MFPLSLGEFLYLLGQPLSSKDAFSDKRLISSLIKESGNNCTLEFVLFYHHVRGADIEVATQNVAKAYTPISNYVIQKRNETSRGK